MTVCIAAIYEEDKDQQGIMLCADGRLSHSWAGSTERNVKISDIGHGWTSLLAGDWTSGVSLRNHVAQRWKELHAPSTMAEAHASALSIANEFLASPFHQKRDNSEMLLCGFVAKAPIILCLRINRSKITLDYSHSFMAIGSGAYIASVFIQQRNYSTVDGRERSAYVVFEAKKHSESDPNVGSAISMGTILPSPSGSPADGSCSARFSEAGIKYLEGLRARFGLQALPDLQEFPKECFDSSE